MVRAGFSGEVMRLLKPKVDVANSGKIGHRTRQVEESAGTNETGSFGTACG